MASKPPEQCCVIGVKHEGKTKGEITHVGDVRTYFSYPEDKSTHNAVLILTDILGIDVPNVQLIADQFAANGYFTIVPDLFYGNVLPMNAGPEFDVNKWLQNELPRPPKVDPIIEAVIKHVRGELGVKRLGGVGYCFGGKYVVRWLKEGKLDVGYSAHPSFVDVEELEGIRGPYSISAAETDHIFPTDKRRETEDILQKLHLPYQLNLFSGVEHGFAVRADLSKKEAKFAKEQAFLQAVSWFDEYLKP